MVVCAKKMLLCIVILFCLNFQESRDIWNIIKKVKAGNWKSSVDHHNLQVKTDT